MNFGMKRFLSCSLILLVLLVKDSLNDKSVELLLVVLELDSSVSSNVPSVVEEEIEVVVVEELLDLDFDGVVYFVLGEILELLESTTGAFKIISGDLLLIEVLDDEVDLEISEGSVISEIVGLDMDFSEERSLVPS